MTFPLSFSQLNEKSEAGLSQDYKLSKSIVEICDEECDDNSRNLFSQWELAFMKGNNLNKWKFEAVGKGSISSRHNKTTLKSI